MTFENNKKISAPETITENMEKEKVVFNKNRFYSRV